MFFGATEDFFRGARIETAARVAECPRLWLVRTRLSNTLKIAPGRSRRWICRHDKTARSEGNHRPGWTGNEPGWTAGASRRVSAGSRRTRDRWNGPPARPVRVALHRRDPA